MNKTLLALAVLGLGSLGQAGHSMAMSSGSDSGSNPTATSDPYAQAVKLIDDGKYAEAIPLLQQSIKEKGESADALNELGYANRKLGNWSAGMENYLKALKLEPDHLGANEYLGELYLEQKDLPNAKAQLAKLVAACGTCEEQEELAESIAEYQTANNIN